MIIPCGCLSCSHLHNASAVLVDPSLTHSVQDHFIGCRLLPAMLLRRRLSDSHLPPPFISERELATFNDAWAGKQ